MKTVTFLATLIVALGIQRGVTATLDPLPTYPEGVAEVKWGSSVKATDKIMLARAGVKREGESGHRVRYVGGTLANQPVERWEFIFTEGKLTEVQIRIKPQEPLR